MEGFLSSITNKAQSAINASPLAGHLPTHLSGRSSSPDPHGQPSAHQASAQGGFKSHALDTFQHQLRTIGQQYSPTSPLQKMITNEKGVAIDFDSASRDAKAQSKELFTWGQDEAEDIKDVTDRLAYLNFIQGSLASSLAVKLDAARAPLKALRDAENALTPRRNIRSGYQLQISRLEHDQQSGLEKRIADFKEQLKRAEHEDEPVEKQLALLKRKAIRESEQAKWDALREFGEKLVLVSQGAIPIISALPTLPPTPAQPYAGAQVTAATRASLQRALDNYKTGHISFPIETTSIDKSDAASFGESHASELSSISSDHGNTIPGIPVTPPAANVPLPSHSEPSSARVNEPTPPAAGKKATDPIDPLTLNQTPTTIPAGAAAASPPPVVTGDVSMQPTGVVPTVAETGVPVSAGSEGPGPASGSLLDLRPSRSGGPSESGSNQANQPASDPPAAVAGTGAAVASTHESAEDEKKRLQREERERLLSAQSSVSADDERKRLEREERERILRTDDQDVVKRDEEDLPPYQPI